MYNKTQNNHRPPQQEQQQTKSQQQQNHRLRTDCSLSHQGGGGGLNAFHWHQPPTPDSAAVEEQETPSPYGSPPINVMYDHGETL